LGAATATLGVGVGLAVVGLLGLLLRHTGLFRRVPPDVLNGVAALTVTTYGIYFLRLAYLGTT